jgi:hypothetical protein
VGRLGAGLDRRAGALQHQSAVHTASLHRRRSAPGGDRGAVEQAGEHLGALLVGAVAADRLGDHVDGHERPGGHQVAHLLGDQDQVRQAVLGEAAAAAGLRHQQRGPPELGAAGPDRGVEPGGIVFQGPHRGGRALRCEEAARRGDEGLLLLAQLQLHLASRSGSVVSAFRRTAQECMVI